MTLETVQESVFAPEWMIEILSRPEPMKVTRKILHSLRQVGAGWLIHERVVLVYRPERLPDEPGMRSCHALRSKSEADRRTDI